MKEKKRLPVKKIILFVLIAAAVLMGVYWFLSGGGVSVAVETVKKGDFSDSTRESGVYTTGKSEEVISSAEGNVSGVSVRLNQQVKKGDLIAAIDTAEYESQKTAHENMVKSYLAEAENAEKTEKTGKQDSLRDAEAAVKSAENQLKASAKDLKDSEALFNSGVISEKDYHDSRTKYEADRLSRDAAEKNYETAKQRLDELDSAEGAGTEKTGSSYLMAESFRAQAESEKKQIEILEKKIADCRILSPCDGIVTDLPIETVTQIKSGDRAAVIRSSGETAVETSVLTTIAPYLKKGDSVNMIQKLKGGDVTYKGRITEISDYADKSTSALGLDEYRIRVKCGFITLLEGMKDGYSFDVEFFAYPPASDVISVPNSAVFKDQGGNCVFTVKENRAKKTVIETGHKGNSRTEVRSGISEGDRIVINANVEGLEDGARVEEE